MSLMATLGSINGSFTSIFQTSAKSDDGLNFYSTTLSEIIVTLTNLVTKSHPARSIKLSICIGRSQCTFYKKYISACNYFYF